MSYAKLIHEFLDEGLSGPEEDTLFAELNRNPDLRNEFNRQVKMHVITQNDMASIAPPLATTTAVFSALGFAVPVDTMARPVAAADSGSRLKAILGKYIPVVIAIFLSVVITSFIVSMFAENDNRAINSITAVNGTQPAVFDLKGMEPAKKVAYPIVTSVENSGRTGQIRQSAPAITARREFVQAEPASSSPVERWIPSLAAAETNIILANSNTLIGSQATNDADDYTSVFRAEIPTVFDSEFFNINGGLSDISRYHVLVRASNGSLDILGGATPQFDKDLRTGSLLNNLSVGVFYRLSEHFIAGVELGSEEYNQEFRFNDGNIKKVRLQSPNLYWIGATLRYSISDLLLNEKFYPYVQATAGATEIGILGKAQAGLSMNLLSGIGANIGYEVSASQYSIEGSPLFSVNHGLTVGLVYKLK